jgi:DNA-binding HxlR family transcriptional regulator
MTLGNHVVPLRNRAEHTIRSVSPATPSDECLEIRKILDRIGDKWSLQVVGALTDGPRRFSDLRRQLTGVSQRMLTLTLRLLERDGLLIRTVYSTIPPSVEYELSPLGLTLTEPVRILANWARRHSGEIKLARERFDRDVGEASPQARKPEPAQHY